MASEESQPPQSNGLDISLQAGIKRGVVSRKNLELLAHNIHEARMRCRKLFNSIGWNIDGTDYSIDEHDVRLMNEGIEIRTALRRALGSTDTDLEVSDLSLNDGDFHQTLHEHLKPLFQNEKDLLIFMVRIQALLTLIPELEITVTKIRENATKIRTITLKASLEDEEVIIGVKAEEGIILLGVNQVFCEHVPNDQIASKIIEALYYKLLVKQKSSGTAPTSMESVQNFLPENLEPRTRFLAEKVLQPVGDPIAIPDPVIEEDQPDNISNRGDVSELAMDPDEEHPAIAAAQIIDAIPAEEVDLDILQEELDIEARAGAVAMPIPVVSSPEEREDEEVHEGGGQEDDTDPDAIESEDTNYLDEAEVDEVVKTKAIVDMRCNYPVEKLITARISPSDNESDITATSKWLENKIRICTQFIGQEDSGDLQTNLNTLLQAIIKNHDEIATGIEAKGYHSLRHKLILLTRLCEEEIEQDGSHTITDKNLLKAIKSLRKESLPRLRLIEDTRVTDKKLENAGYALCEKLIIRGDEKERQARDLEEKVALKNLAKGKAGKARKQELLTHFRNATEKIWGELRDGKPSKGVQMTDQEFFTFIRITLNDEEILELIRYAKRIGPQDEEGTTLNTWLRLIEAKVQELEADGTLHDLTEAAKKDIDRRRSQRRKKVRNLEPDEIERRKKEDRRQKPA